MVAPIIRPLQDDKRATVAQLDEVNLAAENKEEWQGTEIKKLKIALEHNVQRLNTEIKNVNININLFWRELLAYYTAHTHKAPQKFITMEDITSCAAELSRWRYQSEIVNGDTLTSDIEFLNSLGPKFRERGNKTLVCSVLGPQSHGKSTLMNFLFGCNFLTAPTRCTSGMNAVFLRAENKSLDNILILDTEGIMSAERDEKDRHLFDESLAMFCILMSDMLLINIRGTADANIREVLSVALYAIHKLNLTVTTKIFFVLRDMGATISREAQEESYTSIKKHLKDISDRFQRPLMIHFAQEHLWLMPSVSGNP